MKLKMIFAVLGALAVGTCFAQESYNIHIGTQYATSSSDNKTNEKITTIRGTYFFKPIVIDTAKPYAELSFLQRATGISAEYSSNKFENAVYSSTTIPQSHVSGIFYVDEFVLGASNSSYDKNFNLKATPSSYMGIKAEKNMLSVGYFVLPNTVLSFVNERETGKYSPSAGLAAIQDLSITTNGLLSHFVYSFGDTETLVFDMEYKKIKHQQTTNQNNTEYGAKVRYYPQNNFYAEGGYKANTGDYAYTKGKTTLAGIGYSFTPRFMLSLIVENFSSNGASEMSSGKSTSLNAGYRF